MKCELIWMGIMRARCKCGENFDLSIDEAVGRKKAWTNDLLLDLYNAHRNKKDK